MLQPTPHKSLKPNTISYNSMCFKCILCLLLCLNFQMGYAQLGGLFKKKKTEDKPKTEQTVTDTTAAQEATANVEPEEKKKTKSNIFQKALLKVAKVASNVGGSAAGGFTTVNDLNDVTIGYGYTTNLLSKNYGLALTDFISGWKDGYDWVSIFLASKDKMKFCKLGGSIKVDGNEAKHEAVGLYSVILAPTDKDRKLEILDKSGQKATYTFKKPVHVLKLVSINNSTTNCQIDANKDFSIQLDNISTNPNAYVEISLTYTVIGIKTTVSIGAFKPTKNLVLPGYILKHLAIDKNVSFKNSTLVVSMFEQTTAMDETGTFKEPLIYSVGSQDAKYVSVTNQPDLYKGIEVKGEEDLKLGKIYYNFTKQNAYYSRAQDGIKKVAISSFAIQGKTDYYNEKTNKGIINRGDKTITTISFPIKPEQLEPIVNELYPKFEAMLKEHYNAIILPAETVTSNAAYIEMGKYTRADEDGLTNFSYSYKGLVPKKFAIPMAGAFQGESTLFVPLGVDAIYKVNISLTINPDTYTMIPVMQVEMLGKQSMANFSYGQPTTYYTANIVGKGYEIKKKVSITDQLVKDIVRADDMLLMFKKGLQQISEAEKANKEYSALWKLKF